MITMNNLFIQISLRFFNSGSIQHLMELEEQEQKLQTENQVS